MSTVHKKKNVSLFANIPNIILYNFWLRMPHKMDKRHIFLRGALIVKGQFHEFFASGFFHEPSSPKPL